MGTQLSILKDNGIHPVYIGAFIHREFRQRVLNYHADKTKWTYHFDHMTCAFKPSDELLEKFIPFLGKEVRLITSMFVKDDSCTAFKVEGMDIRNFSFPHMHPEAYTAIHHTAFPPELFIKLRHPHITYKCSPGIAPFYSNGLLDQMRHPIALRVGFFGDATGSFSHYVPARLGIFNGKTGEPYFGG